MIEMTKLDPKEARRTYTFPAGETVTLSNVVEFADRPTNHRLKTEDGTLHIVPKTWLHIAIATEGWTL
jgi:hypothetical protein